MILGQDPYHGVGQAEGLSFSVPDGIRKPPSLINIFKELKDDLGIDPPASGSLVSWGKEGVLLLNSILTVEKDMAASHSKIGWEEFTDQVIQLVNKKRHLLCSFFGEVLLEVRKNTLPTRFTTLLNLLILRHFQHLMAFW